MLKKFILGITIAFILFFVPTVLSAEPPKPETTPPGQAAAEVPPGTIEAALTFSDDWVILSAITTPLPTIGKMDEGFIPLPNEKNPQGYRCSAQQKTVQLDMDGDGAYDSELEKKENFVTYKIKYQNGVQLNYRMRVFIKGASKTILSDGSVSQPIWAYQRACFLTAKTSLDTFVIIDDNNNGNFSDYGQDALVIGASNKQAIPLSSIIPIKGKFYTLKVEVINEIPEESKKNPKFSGMKLVLTPYTDDTGKIDATKNLKPPKDKVPSVIVRRGNDVFLQLAQKGETTVPTGEYYLASAIFDNRIRVRLGEKSFTAVEKGKTSAPKWGGPFKLVVNPYCEKGGEIIFVQPATSNTGPAYAPKSKDCQFIKMNFPTVIGSLGEEYYTPEEFQDEIGTTFPEKVSFFNVEIKDKKSEQKPFNKGVSPYTDRWIPTDLTGPLYKKTPFWESYRCPIERYYGPVIVKVWVSCPIFGDLIFEQEVQVPE